MPLRRIPPLAFAGAAAVAVLSALTGFEGEVPDAAGVLALLAAAASVVVLVGTPAVRWALGLGFVVLAAVPVADRFVAAEDVGPSFARDRAAYGRLLWRLADADHAGTVLLLIAAAALTLGVVALPRFRRPVWLTVLACLVALGPVAAVARDAAGAQRSAFAGAGEPAGLVWQLGPGFAATVLAGMALVLAMSRADRWLLLPAGALILQVTTAYWASAAASSWELARAVGGRGVVTVTAFLEPGLRMGTSPAAAVSIDWDLDAAVMMAALLLGPALIAAGAARTAGAPAAGPHPAPPPPESPEPDATA